MKKHGGSKKQMSLRGAILFGVIFSFAALLVFSLVISAFIMSTTNPSGSVKTASLVVILLSAIVSGFAVSKRKGSGGVGAAALSSLVFIGLMLVIALISAKGRVSGVILMNALCYLLVSVFFAFIGRKRERRHRR